MVAENKNKEGEKKKKDTMRGFQKYFIYYVIATFILAAGLRFFYNIPLLKTVRASFGFIYVLFIPGFIATYIFFKRKEIDWVERIALSFGLSIAIVILSFFITSFILKIPITPAWNFIVLLFLIIVLSGIAYFRGE